MYSVSQIMIWEYFRRVRWIAIPVIAFALMPWFGFEWKLDLHPFDPNKPEFVLFYLLFATVGVLSIAFGFTGFQTPASRYYTFPISTRTLVAWKVFLPSLIAGTIIALVFGGLNWLYSIELPILGVSLFTAAIAALVVPISSRSDTQNLIDVAWLVFFLVGSVWWLKARFGDFMGLPMHLWTKVTLSELVTMLGTVIAVYWIEVWSVASDRSGKESRWAIFHEWIERAQETAVAKRLVSLQSFRSPEQAHFWYEYQLKGQAFLASNLMLVSMYVFPFMIYAIMYLLGIWALPYIDTTFVVEGFYGAFLCLGLLMSSVGLVSGFFIGIMNFNQTRRLTEDTLTEFIHRNKLFQMGAFQASLPMSNMAYAISIFKTIIKSILVTWCIWAILFLSYRVGLGLFYPQPFTAEFVEEFNRIGLWYLPLTLLGPWVLTANVASIGLTGRNRFVFATYFGLPLMLFCVLMAIALVSVESKELVEYGCIVAVAIVVCGGTVVAFINAVRRKIITYDTMWLASAVAISIVGLAIVLAPFHLTPYAHLLIIAFAALVVLPLATIPSAIACNRHR
jgi:hypothetical protein